MQTKSITVIRSCLLLLAGGFAAQHSRLPLSSEQCLWLLAAAILMFLLRRSRAVALPLLGFALFMQAGNAIVDSRLDADFAGDSMKVRVRVADFPKQSGASVTLLLQPLTDSRVPARTRVTWFEPPQMPRFGEIWELELRLRRPRGSSNPGVFSVENWMFREQLHASGYVVAGHRNQLIHAARLGPVDRLRQQFVDFATDNAGDSAAVLTAIGVGARHRISREQWARYAVTGTSHLMAISGLHIGLAATSIFLLLTAISGVLRLRGNHLDRGMLGGAIAACFYAVLSGLAVPSQRAAMMLGLLALAYRLRRPPATARIVAMVALLLFVLSPISLMQPGFGLSFGAVVVLLWFANARRRSLSCQSRTRGAIARVWQLFTMQGILLLGLMPLTVAFFERVSLLAPAVNLIAVPLFSLITAPLTLLSMLLHEMAGSTAVFLLQLAASSVVAIEKLIGFAAALPFADAVIASAGINWCVVALPALWVLLPHAWPGRWLALVGVLAILIHKPSATRSDCFDLQVLDVGQGLAIVVQSRQRTLLFDTGVAFRGGGSIASQVIVPYLQDRGVEAIDWLVVSHADNDHAGGVAAILAAYPIGVTYLGEPISGFGSPTWPCEAGQVWSADGVEYRFWHPHGDHRSGNDSSCVLSVRVGDHRVLLTGDIEALAEREMLARAASQAVDVIIIPHHGSLTSSTPAMVTRLQPQYAIASAGFDNRWGLPKQAVVSRWQGVGARVLNTATDGAIGMRVCAEGGITAVRRERVLRQRFWHDQALP